MRGGRDADLHRHSSRDREWVDLLAKRIEAAGAIAYLAELDYTEVGPNLNQKLRDAIDACDGTASNSVGGANQFPSGLL
jgi:hypothetical protein